MRNVFALIVLILALIWFFISSILVPQSKLKSVQTVTKSSESTEGTRYLVDLKKLSALLGVEYVEENLVEVSGSNKLLEVALEVVLIYTSENNEKVRVSKLVNDKKEEVDMQIGDQLYNFTVSEINPSFIVLDNGESKTTLKAFEPHIISVLDSPKEVLE